jgi:hypothetical protein
MAAIYEIVVESELGVSCAAAFEGLELSHAEGRTILVGPVEDQAHLAGLLRRVSDLGLTLVRVGKVEDPPAVLGGKPPA